MKKLNLLMLLFVIAGNLVINGQQLNREMKLENLQESSKINPESEKAYIIVKSEVPKLRFDSNRRIDKVNQLNSGEWEIWLPAGTHILKIYADGFVGIEIPATNYGRKKCYEMTIKAVGFAGNYNADENLIETVFECSEDSIYSSYGDFAPTLTVSNIIAYKLPEGKYNFTFSKKGFEDIKKEIEVKEAQSINLTFVKGSSSQFKYTLPGIIAVTSNPAGAEIIINGQKIGNTPFQGDFVSGKHKVELRKPLYYTEIIDITVEQGKIQTIYRELKSKFGYITVSSNIPNSTVLVDDKPIGNAPIDKKVVESGKHKIKIDADLYISFIEEFELADGEEKIIKAELKPNFGSLYVKSLPEDSAIVYLDDKQVGVTPYKNDKLLSGKYMLKVTKKLFNVVEEQIVIENEKKLEKSIVLNRNFGEVVITAKDAKIYLDGKYVGKNTYIGKLTAGKYKIKTESDERYYTKEEEIFISRGEKKEIDLTPEPKMGSVSVYVEPNEVSDAVIYFDDQLKGPAPLLFPAMVGEHSLVAKKEGYLDDKNFVKVLENETALLRIEMKTFEGSRQHTASKWGTVKWITLGATALAGGAAGYFYLAAESNYTKYKEATTQSSVKDYRDKVNSNNSLKNTAIYVATATLSAAVISWVIQLLY